MLNSPVKSLVQHLKEVYSPPQKHRKYTEPTNEHDLKEQMKKNYRGHWKVNGAIHNSMHCNRLPIGDLDNWQILRINMAERSYMHPKKGMKICSVSKEFNTIDGRNRDGSIPYLYESQIPKLQKIRQKLHEIPFKRANSVNKDLFGFPNKVHAKKYQKRKMGSIRLATQKG